MRKRFVSMFSVVLLMLIADAGRSAAWAQEESAPRADVQRRSDLVMKGMTEIYVMEEETLGPVLFDPNDNSKLFYFYLQTKQESQIVAINYRQKTRKIFFAADEYFPKNEKGGTLLHSYKFIDNTTLICLGVDVYDRGDRRNFTFAGKVFRVRVDTNKVEMEMKDDWWAFSDYEFTRRSVTSFVHGDKLDTFDYLTNRPRSYRLIPPERIGGHIQIEEVVLGKDENELLFICREAAGAAGEYDGRIMLVWYDAKADRIIKTNVLPTKAANNPAADFSAVKARLMPDKEAVLFGWGAGVWLYRLKAESLICLLWWEKGYNETPRVEDVSWDSKYLLLSMPGRGTLRSLFVMNTDEFLKYQPAGREIPMPMTLQIEPDQEKPGFIAE